MDALAFWDLPFEPYKTPDPGEARRALSELAERGILESMAGMIISKPYLYDGHPDLPPFDSLISEYVAMRDRPVLAGFDGGHTIPMLTLPVGTLAELDADGGRLRLRESAVL